MVNCDHRSSITQHCSGAITAGIVSVMAPTCEAGTAGDRRRAGNERAVITPRGGLTDVTYRQICVEPAAAAVAIMTGGDPDPTCVYSKP